MWRWIWILECLVAVVGSFVVDFFGSLVRQCYGGGGWWFVGCCGSVVGLVGWFSGGFLFSGLVVFQYWWW